MAEYMAATETPNQGDFSNHWFHGWCEGWNIDRWSDTPLEPLSHWWYFHPGGGRTDQVHPIATIRGGWQSFLALHSNWDIYTSKSGFSLFIYSSILVSHFVFVFFFFLVLNSSYWTKWHCSFSRYFFFFFQSSVCTFFSLLYISLYIQYFCTVSAL